MKKAKGFPFDRARKATPTEVRMFRKAYENTFGEKPPRRRGRPAKGAEKYRDIHIKIHPKALQWAREAAKQRDIGYQTLINEVLLDQAAGSHRQFLRQWHDGG